MDSSSSVWTEQIAFQVAFEGGSVDGRDPPPGGGMRSLISIIIPCFDEDKAISFTYSALSDLADSLAQREQCDAEFIFVDDGSTDDTWNLITKFAEADSRVVGIRLSRNFGHQPALACGYRHARGDATVCLDADLQDPPDVVLEMVRAWRHGADVVLGVRGMRHGETRFKLATARLFYWLINRMGVTHVRPNVGDFRLLSRRALKALLRITGQRPFFREAVGWIGLSTAEVQYDRQPRSAGTTKYTLRKMVRLATDAVVGSNTSMLMFPWYAALAMLILTVMLIAGRDGSLDVTVVSPTSAIILCTVLVLIAQGFQSLYLSRLYEDCRGRPLYIESDVVKCCRESAEFQRLEHSCHSQEPC